MNDSRPDPEKLLKEIKKKEEESSRGKLKIFFGYAAGVGKTYAMLEAAHASKNLGIDVIVGYIEPHSRPETISLLDGLEILPPLIINKKGITLKEFDVDKAIERHPKIILVDELAHTNAHLCRNLKRYQDIEELLKAGIDVYTTVNVQHIESLNDIVYQITKITVNERIPDKVFDNADKIELVDIEPDDLIARLHSGKVYKSSQAKRALENFFTKDNLIALREIALRRTADQINNTFEKRIPKSNHSYYTNEHILICLSSSPSNAKVIRTAARMANAFHGKFTALFVETPNTKEFSKNNINSLRSNVKLAEQLGANIVTIYGDNIPKQIAYYASISNVSKLVIGRSNNKKGLFPKQSFVGSLTELAPSLEIYIIPDSIKPYNKNNPRRFKITTPKFIDILKSILILITVTILGYLFYKLGFNEANIITVYILGVLFISICTDGKLYSTIASFLSVLIFNYFFTEPRFTLKAYDNGYPVTFIIMFIAATLTSTLTKRVKKQGHQSAMQARSTEVLLETSQKLQQATDKANIYSVMGKQLLKLLNSTVMIYPVTNNSITSTPITFLSSNEESIDEYITSDEIAVAKWVLKNNKNAGATTHTLSGARCLYLSVRGQDTVYAVVGIAINKSALDSYERNLLIAMLGEFGLSLEKETINEIKKEIHAQAKQEQLRSNLLRAISHDLRTPLTSILGNVGFLIGNGDMLDKDKINELYLDIYDDSKWLINLVENILSVTRLDNGSVSIKLEPELLDEVILEALKHINRRCSEYNITVDLSDDFLMANMDSKLIIQVIINIVDNAIKYTPPGTNIKISAHPYTEDRLVIEISDNGNGISDTDKVKIFDMFFTSSNNTGDNRRGLGLGLSLCQSIITAHGGEIWVSDNKPKGTIFSFTLKSKEVKIYE